MMEILRDDQFFLKYMVKVNLYRAFMGFDDSVMDTDAFLMLEVLVGSVDDESLVGFGGIRSMAMPICFSTICVICNVFFASARIALGLASMWHSLRHAAFGFSSSISLP